MGNILRPDFSQGKKEDKKKDGEEDAPQKGAPSKELVLEVARQLSDVTSGEEEGNLRFKFVEFFLSRKAEKLLTLVASPSSLSQSRELVKGYTTEELIGWMINSTENDWQTRPGFYQSVWAESRKRMKM